MREPPLSLELFKLDRVLSRERILEGNDPIGLPHTTPSGHAWKISASGKASITLHPPQTDLSRFDRLAVTLRNSSPTPLLVGVTLVHCSESDRPDTSGTSFSGGRETLQPGPAVELYFPRESFGTYGYPRDWSNVREIRLTFGREKTYEGPQEIAILFHRLGGEIRAVPQGPRLTREGLANVLRSDVPGVTEYFGKSSSRTDRKRLSSYSPIDSGLHIPPPHPYPRSTADEILSGRIMGQTIGYPVPWDSNPVGELEWTHFLNRHHFLRDLVEAAPRTGDSRYVSALNRTITDWIETNTVPIDSNGGAGPSWETLSAAWRLREWFWVIGTVWYHPAFRKETRLAMLCSMWEHARHLLDHQGHPNNWIILESAALSLAGLCFPEFEDAEAWVEIGFDRLRTEIGRQFFEDGVLYEISPLYHAICLQALLEVTQAAAESGRRLPDEFDGLLRKAAEYVAALRRPDFTWPSLNDSGGCAGDYTALMTKAGELLDRDELIRIGSRGRVGTDPTSRSLCFPDAGIVVMRSHNGPDAHSLVFRAGPPGGFHHHEDALSLDVSAFGRPVLVDPGITAYAPGALTDYYRSAAAHNMILIDGKGPLRGGMSFCDKVRPAGAGLSWSSEPGLEIATGICTGPWEGVTGHPVVLRTVVLVGKEYWIVRDIVFGSEVHEVTACWQFFPGTVEVDRKSHAAEYACARGTGLVLVPFMGSPSVSVETATGREHPPMGWVSLAGADVPAPACRYRVKASLPVTLIWGLFPTSGLPGGPIEAARREGPDGSAILEICLPDVGRDVITLVPPAVERRVASRSALISGGSRTAPTGDRVESRVLRQSPNPPLHGKISLRRTAAGAPAV